MACPISVVTRCSVEARFTRRFGNQDGDEAACVAYSFRVSTASVGTNPVPVILLRSRRLFRGLGATGPVVDAK